MTKHAMRCTVFALLATLFVPIDAADAGSGSSNPLNAKQAAAQFKKMTNKYLKECKKALKEGFQNFCSQLDDIEDDIKNGDIEVEEAVEDLNTVTSDAYAEMLNEAADTASNIAFQGQQALSFLEPGTGIPPGLIGGDCNTLDQASVKLGKELSKLTDKMEKKAKKFAKSQLKKNDAGITALINAPAPVALAPDPPAEPPMKPLKADFSYGFQGSGGSPSGKLCIGGTYDPRNGASVNVTIKVNGEDFTKNAVVNPTNCSWKVCFGAGTGGSEGPLPAGDYSEFEIDQIQGDEAFTAPGSLAAGVPNAPQ